MRSFDKIVNTSFLLQPAFLSVRRDTVSAAAHYRGASESVNTPNAFFPRRGSLRHRGWARIVHGNNRFGKGRCQLDAKPRLRNGAIRSMEPVYAYFFSRSPFFKLFDKRLR